MSTGLQFLIYAADVADSLNAYSAIVVLLAAPAAVAAFVLDNAGDDSKGGFSFKLAKPFIIAMIALLSVNVLVPSKGTLYAIAATEVAEVVVMSETATKAVEALNRFLDAQLPAAPAPAAATVTVTNAPN